MSKYLMYVYWAGLIWSIGGLLYCLLVIYLIAPRAVKLRGIADPDSQKWVKQKDKIIRSHTLFILVGAIVFLALEVFL
jgi:hypothetical protein